MKYYPWIVLLMLLCVAVFTMTPAAALKLEGAKIMLDVKPGATYTFPMAISIQPDDEATDYTIDILGFGQMPDDGIYIAISADKDTSSSSARTFISTTSSTVRLRPGERKEFDATIMVPENVGAGGRYAAILIHPAAAGTGQTAVATAVLVPVMLTIKGTDLIETGEITGVMVGEVIAGKPIIVATTLKNTGNHHYYGATNQLTVKDSSGREAGSAKTDPFTRAMIPGQSVRFDTPLTAVLPPGTYTVISRMTLGDGIMLDEQSTSFTVKEEYIPPFEETTVTVVPDRETVLKTPGGEIVITFPAGAVLSDARVTVSPYMEALPEPPSGSKVGTTALTVDGLTGLLTKPATIVVRYNPADLQAAGGDATTLLLARWDRANVKWMLTPATVDPVAMTLTATTDRFGIMAVMGGGNQEPGRGGGSLPGPHPAVLFGALAICAVFYLKRKK